MCDDLEGDLLSMMKSVRLTEVNYCNCSVGMIILWTFQTQDGSSKTAAILITDSPDVCLRVSDASDR